MARVSDSKPPKCFISYSWDSEDHKAWVRKFAEDLVHSHVDTVLDQWALKLGDYRDQFMETSISESDYVILVCTPNYTRKVSTGRGGVAYEKSIVTGEMFKGAPASKFIPLLKQGSVENALPAYLSSKYHIDFRDPSDYKKKLEDLLRHMHKEPKYQKPELGPHPFKSSHTRNKATQTTERINEGSEVKIQGSQETEVIDCAYCKGSGNDPNSTMFTTITCTVCNGNGQIRIKVASIRCAFCRGSGRDPNSTMLTTKKCSNCKGKGRVFV